MYKKITYYLPVLCLIIIYQTGMADSEKKVITWTGCGVTKKAFMKEMASQYYKKTGVEVLVSGGGAAKGIRASARGSVDVGGTCRHKITDKQTGRINNKEEGSKLIQVAWDAIVVIVNPRNMVKELTHQQLNDIFDGKIRYWNELPGGINTKINLVTRKGKESGVGYMFRIMAFKDPFYNFKAPSIVVKSSSPLEKIVEEDANAIAIDGISSAKKRNIKILSIDGVFPTKKNMASGKYKLFRPLYLSLSKKNPSKEGAKLIEFVLSPEGQKIISKQGTVNLQEGKALIPLWNKRKKELGITTDTL